MNHQLGPRGQRYGQQREESQPRKRGSKRPGMRKGEVGEKGESAY